MTSWTAGYVADIGYTYGYYTELNPVRVSLAFLNAGLVPPQVGTACELGFGQGMSANIHAAAHATGVHQSATYATEINGQDFGALAEITNNGTINLFGNSCDTGKSLRRSQGNFDNRQPACDQRPAGVHCRFFVVKLQNRDHRRQS